MISFTKVIHMVIAVALTFISLAGLYVILEAEFVAFVQVLIYAGAISILMIFGIMMTKHRQGEEEEPKRPWHEGLAIIGALGLFGCCFMRFKKRPSSLQVHWMLARIIRLKSENCSITSMLFPSKSCRCC